MFARIKQSATVALVTSSLFLISTPAMADATSPDVEVIQGPSYRDPAAGAPLADGWTTADTLPSSTSGGSAPDLRPLAIFCEPVTNRTYKQLSWKWHAFDAGTAKNTNAKATAHKTITHSSNEEYTTTWSGETSLTLKGTLAEINLKLGYSTASKSSYTTTTTFTVDIPPKSTVKYKDGIIERTIRQKTTQTFSNCQQSVKTATVRAAESYSEIS